MRHARYTGRHTPNVPSPGTLAGASRADWILCSLFMLAVVAVACVDWVAVDLWLMN
jgi:hypothetical protein